MVQAEASGGEDECVSPAFAWSAARLRDRAAQQGTGGNAGAGGDASFRFGPLKVPAKGERRRQECSDGGASCFGDVDIGKISVGYGARSDLRMGYYIQLKSSRRKKLD